MKPIAYLAWESAKVLARQRGQLVFMIVTPLAWFFTYMSIFARGEPAAVAAFLPACLALLVTTHGMYGVSIDLLVMREFGMLSPYQLTPLSPLQILLSRVVVNCAYGLLLATCQVVLAVMLYDLPLRVSPLPLFVVILLGNIALGTLGMLIFSISNSMNEANFISQTIFLLLFVLSGITAPLASLPQAAAVISAFLPTTLLVRTLQGMLVGGTSIVHWWPELLVMAAFIISSLIVAVRLFRWSAAQKATAQSRRVALLAVVPLLVAGIWINLR
jgi:ABC-type multidrug transport system permease subunit